MGKILITRPLAQATNLSKELKMYGFDNIIHPLLKIEFLKTPQIDFEKYNSCIITSLNAAKILLEQNIEKNLNIYCIGHKTAQFLRQSGFKSIKNISPSVGDLVTFLKHTNIEGSIIYLRGDVVTLDLKQLLPNHQIEEFIVYKSHKIKELDENIIQALLAHEISDILFYSARTFEAFIDAISNHEKQVEIRKSLTRTRALCLTDKMVKYVLGFEQERGIDFKFKAILSLQDKNENLTIEALIYKLKKLNK